MKDLIYNLADWNLQDEQNRCTFSILAEAKGKTVQSEVIVTGPKGLILQALANAFEQNPRILNLISEAVQFVAIKKLREALQKDTDEEDDSEDNNDLKLPEGFDF